MRFGPTGKCFFFLQQQQMPLSPQVKLIDAHENVTDEKMSALLSNVTSLHFMHIVKGELSLRGGKVTNRRVDKQEDV